MFIVLLHCTTKDVIPRRGGAPTWESPVIQILRSIDRGDCHVAWLVPAMLLAMTVVVDGWLRRCEQSDKLKFEDEIEKRAVKKSQHAVFTPYLLLPLSVRYH